MDWTLDFGESHILVSCDVDLRSGSLGELVRHYGLMVSYINENPLFKSSYEPVEVGADAPEIARRMSEAASACGVGPMAAVAGALAQILAEYLLAQGASDVIVDNGGDIYLKSDAEKIVGIHAGPSPLSDRFAFRVKPEEMPCGICTSSASVGPSISLGRADSVTAVADSGALADAAATAIGNLVRDRGDFEAAISGAGRIEGLRGVVLIKGEDFAAWGSLPQLV